MTAMDAIRSFRILFALICLSCLFPAEAQQKATQSGPIAVYFSPHGGATNAIIRTINNAKESILVQAYSFTSEPIAGALVRAKKRGVLVQVILDRNQLHQKYSCVKLLATGGVSTLIDANHAIAHNKVIVLDSETVITGSFNFTSAAEERNAENLLMIRDKDLAVRLMGNWRVHRIHSQPYHNSKERNY